MADMIKHPNHYNHSNRSECWEEMIDLFGAERVATFDILNAYKYYYRAGEKEGNSYDQDISKAIQYLQHAKETLYLRAPADDEYHKLMQYYHLMCEYINDMM